jgi:hypothetical protein
MSLLQIDFDKLASTYALLEDSLGRVRPLQVSMLNDSLAMEPYDALASRFERLVEIALNRFFRSVELRQFGKKSDSLRDRILNMQKLGLVASVELWMEMREFRNRIAHDYLPEQLVVIFTAIQDRFYQELKHCILASRAFMLQVEGDSDVST